MDMGVIVLTLAALRGPAVGAPAISPTEFAAWFEAASRGRLRIPDRVRERAVGFRYVFVGGFGSERMPGYFTQNAAELRNQGVPAEAIHLLFPSSRRTVEENRDRVRAEFLRLASSGPERLVVIAHSRGACDALAFALQNPAFVRDHVEVMILVQAPFGGSGLADYVLGDGEPMDRRTPPLRRAVLNLLGRRERALVSGGRHGGLAGLTREDSRAYWRRMLDVHAEAIQVVGPRIFYIQSQTRPSRLRPLTRAMGHYLGMYYGPNDGMVAPSDQVLPGLGTSLVTLEAGHPDLTRRFPATRAGRQARRALSQAILMAVGQNRQPARDAKPVASPG